MGKRLYRTDGDVALMNFLNFNWADSNIESINIEYDIAVLKIWNDVLQKWMIVKCSGFAGITNLCIWDDTIIVSLNLSSVKEEDNEFVKTLFKAYDKHYDYCGRSLEKGLFELKIDLVNNTSFYIYCQNVEVQDEGQ